MIGYYIHHSGRGHLSRAAAIAAELGDRVTALSSLDRPADWMHDWVDLPRDDALVSGAGALDADTLAAHDVDAGGRLHWVPLGDRGLRNRMAAVSAWIAEARPSVVVADVSVELALLARLHGVPVVTVALPGRRDDAAHRLGFAVSSAIISAWPVEADGMLCGLDGDARAKHVPVGAISRFAPAEGPRSAAAGRPPRQDVVASGRRPRVLVLGGAAGGLDAVTIRRARDNTPQWDWDVVGGAAGRWVDDPWPRIRNADVVVTHAGQNAIAEVAAARKPAVVVPEPRPHDEQGYTARVLSGARWPAVVVDDVARADWADVLSMALDHDGQDWAGWNSGSGAASAAAVIERVAWAGTGDQHPVAVGIQ